MKQLLYSLVAGFLFACQPNERAIIDPQYNDWQVLRSPDNRSIEAVWGDIDNTVVISTMFTLYRTTDQGRNWTQVHAQNSGMMGLTEYRDTLFVTTGLLSGDKLSILVNPAQYSIDKGSTWQPYRRFNPAFDLIGYANYKGITVNPVTATNGTTYTIRRQYLDDSTKITRRFITPGVVTQTGRRIDLPKIHQLASLALDTKGRLYVAGSDDVCESSPNFRFCNGGRGIIYVSKQPTP